MHSICIFLDILTPEYTISYEAECNSYVQAIIFPKEGNWVHYMRSLEKLSRFDKERNEESDKALVKTGCGHVTSCVDGVRQLFHDIIESEVPLVHS